VEQQLVAAAQEGAAVDAKLRRRREQFRAVQDAAATFRAQLREEDVEMAAAATAAAVTAGSSGAAGACGGGGRHR
jgi:hypothetical protein